MNDFSAARMNMVDCQIQTNGVINPVLLEAFETTPRERFVPKALQNVAYCDEDLLMGDGHFLLEPITHGKMLEALAPQAHHIALDVGVGYGYSSAIMSPLVSTVIAVEAKKKYLDHAQAVWDDLGVPNVVSFKGPLKKGCAEHGPYNSIMINGAVDEIPQCLIDQLAPNGRLIAVVKPAGKDAGHVLGQVTLVESLGEKGFSSYTLFEAGCPYLPGFAPKPAFAF